MPEDQGVNGNRWTDQASRLLDAIGWKKVADSNIDIPGSDGFMHGIDAMFKFTDGFNPTKEQGVFLEAKRYKTDSFNKAKLHDWISKIDEKLREIRRSESFHQTYPAMSSCQMNNALLAIWFHDTNNFDSYKARFVEALQEVRTPKGRGTSTVNNLLVITNDKILQLASLCDARNDLLNRRSFVKVKFFYPSSAGHGFPIQETDILNFSYMFSKLIFAKGQDRNGKTYDIVFYFGEIDIHSFKRIREALLTFDMLSASNSLILYKYKRDDEFRKIKPDVEALLSQDGPSEVIIDDMTQHSNLPNWMEN